MIKSTPYRLFTMIMALVVLLSSTGFGLVEHSCMMRGKSVELAALKNAETACGMCKPTIVSGVQMADALQFKAKPCCEESQSHQKIEVVSASSTFAKVLKSLPFAAALDEHMGSPLRAISFLLPGAPARFLPPLLPKHYGRTMLLFVQSFLI